MISQWSACLRNRNKSPLPHDEPQEDSAYTRASSLAGLNPTRDRRMVPDQEKGSEGRCLASERTDVALFASAVLLMSRFLNAPTKQLFVLLDAKSARVSAVAWARMVCADGPRGPKDEFQFPGLAVSVYAWMDSGSS